MNVKTPTLKTEKISVRRLTFGIWAAPVAWLMQMYFSDIIASYDCYPHQSPLLKPLWHGTDLWFALISLFAFSTGLFAGLASYREWQRLSGDGQQQAGSKQGWEKFLVISGLCFSAMFSLAIIFTSLGILLVSPCGK